MSLPQIKLEPGAPRELAFKFSDGKPVGKYGSIMFTTTDDQVLFLEKPVAEQITALHLQPGQTVRICRPRDKGEWQVERIPKPGEQPNGTFAIPKAPELTGEAREAAHRRAAITAHATETLAARADSPLEFSGLASGLKAEVNMLVDVFAACVAYSQRYNGAVKTEDVRTLLITSNIPQRGRAGRL